MSIADTGSQPIPTEQAPPRAAPYPVPAEVAEQVRAIAAALTQSGREPHGQALLTQLQAPARARPALYVAGEDKRGKSCLVNALLGRPDLSPVGVEVVTAAPITFFAAAAPTARVYRYGSQKGEEMEFDAARALATVAGNPRNRENVSGVSLGVDNELLRSLNLIDTPGVGGLESGHAKLTLQSLQRADALLFVTEAGAQFRAEELSFLRKASARVETVILVLTKTDLHRGWRTIMADDRAILAEQAPRFANAPIVPVSSVLALRALSMQDPEDVQALREESGLQALEQLIRGHVAERATALRGANLLRTGVGALGGAELGLRQTLAASGPNEGARTALARERARLQELQRDKTTWPAKLDAEIRKLTLERGEAASRGTVEIKRRFDDRLRDVKKREFDELPGELVADLTALAAQLNEQAAQRLTAIVDQRLNDIGEPAELTEAIATLTADALREELETREMGDFGMSFNDKLSVMSSFSSGKSLGSLAGVVAGSIVAPPIGLALGVGLGGLFAFSAFLTRDQKAFQVQFASWMAAQISHAQLTINNVFQRQMIDVQSEIREAVGDALIQREREINESLHQAETVMRSETARRQSALSEMQARLAAIRQVRESALAMLAQLAPAAAAPQPEHAAG